MCRAGQMFDEMRRKKTKLCAGEMSGGDASVAPEDRLNSLPDALLHHIMSFLRAWEVARTCVLSRRWRHLWTSVPCVDLRVWRLGRHRAPPFRLARFVYHFLLEREVSAPVDTLRLVSSPVCDKDDDENIEDYSTVDVDIWVRAAIKRRARVIQLTAHPKDEVFSSLWRVNVISCHLKHLKLSGSMLRDRMLSQLSSQCPSFVVLDLKDCYLDGCRISSASLKSLAIIECQIMADLTIAAPNLLSLRCVTPHHRVPLFENLDSLAAATVVLDDSFLYVGYEYQYKDINKSVLYEGSDSNSYCSLGDDSDYGSDADSDSDTCEYSEIANDYEDKQCGDHDEGHSHSEHGNYHGYGPKHKYGKYQSYQSCGRKNRFCGGKIVGGHNVLHSLSNATSLELLADAGEVILNRELKTCPIFSNLKTLSLGEWCMAADFDPLVSFLQHSPNLERLFLELKLEFKNKEAMEDSTKPEGRPFACTNHKMVKINCSKDDTRVHLLAQLFRTNGVPVENIYVSQQLPSQQTLVA